MLECTRDSIKRHGCTANAGEQSYKCRVPIVGEILYATVFNAVAGHICNPATYPLAADAKESYAWYENYIYTTTDCRAVFDVYFDVCETGKIVIRGTTHDDATGQFSFFFLLLCSCYIRPILNDFSNAYSK